MKIKDYKSRLGALLLAGTMAATMVPGVAFAADGEVTKTYSGTVHRADGDHFGDYDFTAKFTTVDGVLTSVYFDSDNWNKEINATTYSQDAIDELLDQLRAQETLNAEELDNVTGATRSADGIKAVITEALADEELGIQSVAEEVAVTFNVTDDNKGSGRGEGGGNHGGETTEPVTAEQTYSGSVHRADGDHFGDYDFTAKFTTVDGVLTSIYFDSENWNKEINATTYSQDAIDDLLDQLRAQETLNAEGLDNVTGATRSSDGIKAVITEALADEALGIKSVAEDVEVTFNVTDDNKGSGRGEGGGNHGGETTEPVTAEKTLTGTVHRADDDHFGDYDFTAKFTVVDGVLTSIYFDSEDWGKEKNVDPYCQDAIDELLDQLRAQETLNAEGLDSVTGATRSSNAFKELLTEALADEELGIQSIAEDVAIDFNVTEDNVNSSHGSGGNHGGETTEPVTAEQTYSGSVHRADDDHFGDYDFTAKFTTVDGVLTSIYFDSENWNKEINATTYSQDAIDDLLDQLRAQETLNAEGLDNVTGATRSSDGIKAVITEALADEALGIKSVAEDVEVTFNVTDDNKGSGRGEGGGKPTTPSVSEVFSDVQADQWYTEAIQYVYTNGIMAGMGNGTFGTQENLTRAHIAQILYNVEGKPEVSSTSKFSDVQNKSSWYYTAVVWANENGIMAGYGKGKFGPQDTLTREQMATVLYNYAKYKQEDVSATTDLSSYTDANKISGWAQTPMKWAVATEVISGTTETTLAPLGFCTRAQAAQMMANRQK